MVCPISYYVIIRDETRAHNDLLTFEWLSFSSKLGGFQPEHLFDYNTEGPGKRRVVCLALQAADSRGCPSRDNRRFIWGAMRRRSRSAASPNLPYAVAWLCGRTGDGRSSRRRCRWGAGSRSGRCRVLLELQPWSPIPATRRFGAHGPAPHLGTAFRAYRHADKVLVSALGANGACHVNGRWSKAHCLILSIYAFS